MKETSAEKIIEDKKHILFSKGNVFVMKSGKLQTLCKNIRDGSFYDPKKLDEARTQIFETKKKLEELSELIDAIECAAQPSLFDGVEEDGDN